jgi:hypothetical protein
LTRVKSLHRHGRRREASREAQSGESARECE